MKSFAKSLSGIAVAGIAGAVALGIAPGDALAAEKWDMPLAYPASNYHSETAAKFAEEITKASNGELEVVTHPGGSLRSEEHTSELQSLMRISYAVFCLTTKRQQNKD